MGEIVRRSEWGPVARRERPRWVVAASVAYGAATGLLTVAFPVVPFNLYLLPVFFLWAREGGAFGRARSAPDEEGRVPASVEYSRPGEKLGMDEGHLAVGADWLWFDGERTSFCVRARPQELRGAESPVRSGERDEYLSFAIERHGVGLKFPAVSVPLWRTALAEAEAGPRTADVAEIAPVDRPAPPRSGGLSVNVRMIVGGLLGYVATLGLRLALPEREMVRWPLVFVALAVLTITIAALTSTLRRNGLGKKGPTA